MSLRTVQDLGLQFLAKQCYRASVFWCHEVCLWIFLLAQHLRCCLASRALFLLVQQGLRGSGLVYTEQLTLPEQSLANEINSFVDGLYNRGSQMFCAGTQQLCGFVVMYRPYTNVILSTRPEMPLTVELCRVHADEISDVR